MYIGSSPNFGALDSQTITSANGSTATFTLNQFVPDSDSIIVTVGNVVQEPTEAYTASGNSITFTENVPNGDTIVIRYLGRSVDVYTGYKRVQRFKFVATNGQQTFTGADANSRTLEYTAQDIDVFYNGVRLDESEFTATNGSSVILGTGATTNAELVILAYKVVQLADVVPASSGGTFTGNVVFSGNATVNGNLTASGTTTLVDTTNTVVKDNLLGLNHGATSNSNDAGIIVERGSTGNDALLIWDESADKWALGTTTSNASSTGNLNMTTGTLVANLEGTIQTASQTNITTVGTLTSATVSGDLTVDTNTLKVDSTNNKVLIGTTSESNTTGLGVVKAGGANFIARFQNTTSGTPFGVSIAEPSSAGAGYPLLNIANHDGSVTRFRVDSSTGHIGIGRPPTANDTVHILDSQPIIKLEENSSGGSKMIQIGVKSNGTPFLEAPQSGGIIDIFLTGSHTGRFHSGGIIGQNSDSASVAQLTAKALGTSNSSSQSLILEHSTNHFDGTSSFIIGRFSSFNRFLVFSNGSTFNASNTYGNISDERLKTDIVDAKSQWDDLKNLKVRNFKKYDTGDLVQLGVVAQEVEKVSPSLIQEVAPSVADVEHNSDFGSVYKDGDDIPEGKKIGDVNEKEKVKAIKYSVLYMKAIKALQEAMERIETLEDKVKALEKA